MYRFDFDQIRMISLGFTYYTSYFNDNLFSRNESATNAIWSQLVATWFLENKLLINPEKTKLLFIEIRQLLGKLQEEMSITFLGEEIIPTANAKDLGLTLDSHLTYDYHIKNVVSSCMAKLCQINRVKDSYDRDTLRLIINALVMSKLYNCFTVWSNTSVTNIKKREQSRILLVGF